MQFSQAIISEGEIQTTAYPDEGLFLLSYIDILSRIYQYEGTWSQIQDFIVDEINAYEDVIAFNVINSKKELLELDLY